MSKKFSILLLVLIIGVASISYVSVRFAQSIFLEASTLSQNLFGKQTKDKNIIYPTVGVMIENELLARPYQKGLSKASVVYETLAEGGITRFLAIFDATAYPTKIGPVRSARSYFVQWIKEYSGAVFAHAGGSQDALRTLKKDFPRDADQFQYNITFYREKIKTSREHTLFTTDSRLKKLITGQKWTSSEEQTGGLLARFAAEKYADISSYAPVSAISIPFSTKTYAVSYSYNPTSKYFLRSQAGKPHVDTLDGSQLSAAAVIIQYVTVRNNNDKAGSITIKTTGSGNATIFVSGRAIPAVWNKKSVKDATQFLAKDSSLPVEMPAGPIWIEVVPNTIKATIK